jgi:predicted transcriptional regulator of viral defense system
MTGASDRRTGTRPAEARRRLRRRTVGEVAEVFGTERGLARSTVLTMMERLRKKGQLVRRLDQGVYRYRARATSAELMQGVVQRFVERNLGGQCRRFSPISPTPTSCPMTSCRS